MLRATVIINRPELDDEGMPRYLEEWVHLDEYRVDELGVTVEYGDRGGTTFVPWSSVLKVNVDTCECVECSRR